MEFSFANYLISVVMLVAVFFIAGTVIEIHHDVQRHCTISGHP